MTTRILPAKAGARWLPAVLVATTLAFSVDASADESPPPDTVHHTAAPWIVASVGAGVAVVGVLSFVGAVVAHNDVASESAAKGCSTSPTVVCPAGVDGTNIKTNLDGEHAMNILGVILSAAGGAALIGGLIWHFVEPVGPRAHSAFVVAPSLGPGYGGLSVLARF